MDRDESSVWHEAAAALPRLTDSNVGVPEDVLETKTTVAQRLLDTEAESYQKKLSHTNAADAQWLQTVLFPVACMLLDNFAVCVHTYSHEGLPLSCAL